MFVWDIVLLFTPVVIGEYCPSYNDSFGDYKKGFYCPSLLRLYTASDQYCCGNNTYRRCCYDIAKSIFNHTESRPTAYWTEYWPYLAMLGFALVASLFAPFLSPHRRS